MDYVDDRWREAAEAARAALLHANNRNLGDLKTELGIYKANLGVSGERQRMPQAEEMRMACEKLSVAGAYYVLARVGEAFGERFPDLNLMKAVGEGTA